jgi:serine/threonine protein kinase
VTSDTARNCLDDTELWPAAFGEPVPHDVREHVERCPACRARTELLRSDVESLRGVASRAAEAATAHSAVIPRRIGPYRILGLVEEGELIFRCRAISSLAGDEVLLDVARSAESAAAPPQSLASDCERLRQLSHPGIARVYDLNRYDGIAVLAQEFVRGTPLADFLRGHAISRAEAISLAGQIAEAVAAAHQAGIAHGRLTPASICVVAPARAVLKDFGRSALAGDDAPPRAAIDRDLDALAAIAGCLIADPNRLAELNGELPEKRSLSAEQIRGLPPELAQLVHRT